MVEIHLLPLLELAATRSVVYEICYTIASLCMTNVCCEIFLSFPRWLTHWSKVNCPAYWMISVCDFLCALMNKDTISEYNNRILFDLYLDTIALLHGTGSGMPFLFLRHVILSVIKSCWNFLFIFSFCLFSFFHCFRSVYASKFASDGR